MYGLDFRKSENRSHGQAEFASVLLGIGIVAIVVLSLLPTVADEIFTSTNTFTITNESIADVDNNTAYRLGTDTLRRAVSITTVQNASLVIGSGNYTLTNYANQTAWLNFSFVGGNTTLAGTDPFNVTYDYVTTQYVEDSSARAILPLTILFIALAVLIMFVGLIRI